MINLSECKFGDRLRTRGGKMAVFLHKSFVIHEVYICAIEYDEWSHLEMRFWANGKRYYDNEPSEFDIIEYENGFQYIPPVWMTKAMDEANSPIKTFLMKGELK